MNAPETTPLGGPHPLVIQGGMGVAVSSWQLAREVSRAGHLGVVSGTALDAVLARALQDGDPGGHRRRALEHFPDQDMVARVLERYHRPEGREGRPYRPTPTLTVTPTTAAIELGVLGNFVEVWLAKEGHDGIVGINFLEKIQMGTPIAALGAMIAGVDRVLMGAGIPREIPRLLRDLEAGREAGVTIDVAGATRRHVSTIDPVAVMGAALPTLRRPQFYAIVSLHSLATYLHRDPEIRPDGFVVEGPPAGGHSAPPRGRMTLDDRGEPVYGPRDAADLAAIGRLGLPFWLAGAYGTPEGVEAARAAGAAGVQAGTVFALCAASGLAPSVRGALLEALGQGRLDVRNDPRASPTGFPFKIADVAGSTSDPRVHEERPRLCDLSYLRTPYERPGGGLGYRCASEPVDAYLKKGGVLEDTVGRMCLCNGLMADIGLGQERKDGYVEPPAVTLGQDLAGARRLLAEHPGGWTAREAVEWLCSRVREPALG
ncbi:nitronate monooxygenase [Mobilicoccus pelagius]|uniref:Putative 2-nitropropane dioxygenase n=1 Tax=Mobilicoccus pelagius NBRC 104925 TaxID=1089455 RepID=H5URY0_9MICO|nr:nitronate monooxygenase [Mobilicoccus pelagius]GAB48488.1 putative 2-nitropropane dioxygenase [Mobilicoccus pelagius NBRC 104925]